MVSTNSEGACAVGSEVTFLSCDRKGLNNPSTPPTPEKLCIKSKSGLECPFWTRQLCIERQYTWHLTHGNILAGRPYKHCDNLSLRSQCFQGITIPLACSGRGGGGRFAPGRAAGEVATFCWTNLSPWTICPSQVIFSFLGPWMPANVFRHGSRPTADKRYFTFITAEICSSSTCSVSST